MSSSELASIATGLVLENIVRLGFGNEPRGYDRPIARDVFLGDIRVSPQQLETMALALAIMLVVFAALAFTRIGKAMRAVLNASLRPILERALGGYLFPEGSIVFATTNLTIEGLGDTIPAHARNRMVQCRIRKPTAMEWVEDYAIANNIEPVIIGTVLEFPQMLQSFEEIEDPASNVYINDQRCPRNAVVTHRTMEKASIVLDKTAHLPDDVRLHALCGLIGEPAALDMMTIMRLDEDLPTWDQITSNPDKVKVPTSAVANCMLVSKACQRVERDTFGAWMTFCKRMPKEVQALFGRGVMAGEKMSFVVKIAEFTKWARDSLHLL